MKPRNSIIAYMYIHIRLSACKARLNCIIIKVKMSTSIPQKPCLRCRYTTAFRHSGVQYNVRDGDSIGTLRGRFTHTPLYGQI